jgi:hypothetical protein
MLRIAAYQGSQQDPGEWPQAGQRCCAPPGRRPLPSGPPGTSHRPPLQDPAGVAAAYPSRQAKGFVCCLHCSSKSSSQQLALCFAMQEDFPDPRVNSQQEWNAAPLWCGISITATISYEAMRSSWEALFRKLEIHISKRRHTFRIMGACRCDNAGLEETVSTLLQDLGYDDHL